MRVRRATVGRGQQRRLVIEDLEQRLVLDGLGLPPNATYFGSSLGGDSLSAFFFFRCAFMNFVDF
jgi:hypothetical protein